MASGPEIAAMRRAVALAAEGAGATSPNPVVGAVVLDGSGTVVGEGFHSAYGAPHAEVVALQAAGRLARGGTLVLTLEPCDHVGRTGRCTEAIRAAGIGRVVYAVADPAHPGGAARLRGEGVDVEAGVLAAEATEVNEAWLAAVRLGRPFVTWKYAATLDGRAAAADGTSRWITGPEARADGHLLRAAADAILVGVGTVLTDDPQLTVRHVPARRQPLRVVLDTDGRTPPTARVRDAAAPTLVLTGGDVKREVGGRLSLPAVLELLFDRGVRGVLVEGGPTLAGALLRDGLIDKVVGYLAPVLLGAGPTVLADAGIGTIAAARRFRFGPVDRLGDDLRLVGYPEGD